MDQFLQFVEYHFVVLCKCCGGKVMDPDKKKGQIHLKGKCPSCGNDSKEKKSKKERKAERRAEKEKNKGCRAKY